MVPTEYRLEHVVAGLIERLDGARRSFDTPEALAAGFRRIADEHVSAVIDEWRDLGFGDPERHAAFLQREVIDTALPRLVRVASEMNASEAEGHGLGGVSRPTGRLGLVGMTLIGLFFLLRVSLAYPMMWPVLLALLALPFLPDVARWLADRRYQAALDEAVSDMGRIQEQVASYAPTGRAQVAERSVAEAPRREPPPSAREGQ